MLTPEMIAKLKAPFRFDQHTDRTLPGGGTWFYIKWQLVRERIEECDPNYFQEFGTPYYLGDYCHVSCTLVICGVSRQAIGNGKIEMLSPTGKNMERGNAIERAIADALKNAAEAFGIAAYLDDQEKVIRILSGSGDQRAYKYAKSSQQTEAGLPPSATPKPKPSNNRNSVPSPSINGRPAGWTPSF